MRIAKAAKLVKAARSAVVANRRASAISRTGGFMGAYTRNRLRNFTAELKFVDTSGTAVNIPFVGAITLINGVAQGSDFNNRIGRKSINRSILTNITFYPSTSGTGASQGDFVRVMIVYDMQTNSGTTPNITDILATADVNSPNNLNNRDRFRILMDKRYTFWPTAYATGALANGNNGITKWCHNYKKMHLDTIWSGVNSSVGNIQSGALFFLYISKGGFVNMDYYFRTRFYDT